MSFAARVPRACPKHASHPHQPPPPRVPHDAYSTWHPNPTLSFSPRVFALLRVLHRRVARHPRPAGRRLDLDGGAARGGRPRGQREAAGGSQRVATRQGPPDLPPGMAPRPLAEAAALPEEGGRGADAVGRHPAHPPHARQRHPGGGLEWQERPLRAPAHPRHRPPVEEDQGHLQEPGAGAQPCVGRDDRLPRHAPLLCDRLAHPDAQGLGHAQVGRLPRPRRRPARPAAPARLCPLPGGAHGIRRRAARLHLLHRALARHRRRRCLPAGRGHRLLRRLRQQPERAAAAGAGARRPTARARPRAARARRRLRARCRRHGGRADARALAHGDGARHGRRVLWRWWQPLRRRAQRRRRRRL